MKKNLFFVMALLSLSIVSAQDFVIDDIAYHVIPGTTNVEVDSKSGCYAGAVTIPETVTYNASTYTVTSVGFLAFRGCSSLTSVSLSSSITSIETGAFLGCSGLTSVDFSDAVISIGESAFSGCESLTSVELPNSLKTISENAFVGCDGLTSVVLGESLVVIAKSAFNGCESLVSLDIPDSVYYIGPTAFRKCEALTSVTLGNSVSILDHSAFSLCENLASVTLKRPTPIFIYETVFGNINLAEVDLHVPTGSELAYGEARVWKDFNIVTANPIVASKIEDPEDGIITVFPLPANDRLNIKELGSAKLEEATLFDFNSNEVKKSTENTMDISNLSKGLYTLKVKTDQGVITKKVLKN